jgi:hypothetical protein
VQPVHLPVAETLLLGTEALGTPFLAGGALGFVTHWLNFASGSS